MGALLVLVKVIANSPDLDVFLYNLWYSSPKVCGSFVLHLWTTGSTNKQTNKPSHLPSYCFKDAILQM